MALGLKNGAGKYGPFNWRVEPVQGRVYLEAALRHLLLLLDGEDYDRDTGIHHAAFVLSTVAIFLDSLVQGTQIDNRALPGRSGDLVAFFNDLPGQQKSRVNAAAQGAVAFAVGLDARPARRRCDWCPRGAGTGRWRPEACRCPGLPVSRRGAGR